MALFAPLLSQYAYDQTNYDVCPARRTGGRTA